MNRLKITTNIILQSKSFSAMLSAVLINISAENNIRLTEKKDENHLLNY